MSLRVVGAGLGRTGTTSLKAALERLLGGRCYHMTEVFQHPEHVPLWTAAGRGEPLDPTVFDGYVATVDWPGATFWRELADANPDAIVLLSARRTPEQWWRSASRTIFEAMRRHGGEFPNEVVQRVVPVWDDAEAAMAAYEAHNRAVREAVPAGRLVEWTPEDGWEPLCAGLGVAVPGEPFPVTNTTDEFRSLFGFDR